MDGGRVGGTLAWLGVRTCLPAVARTMDPWQVAGFVLRFGSWPWDSLGHLDYDVESLRFSQYMEQTNVAKSIQNEKQFLIIGSWDDLGVLIVMRSDGGSHVFPVRYTRPTCILRKPFFINTLRSTLISTTTTSMTSIIIGVHMFDCREIHL